MAMAIYTKKISSKIEYQIKIYPNKFPDNCYTCTIQVKKEAPHDAGTRTTITLAWYQS